jgi:hypothetical protein
VRRQQAGLADHAWWAQGAATPSLVFGWFGRYVVD